MHSSIQQNTLYEALCTKENLELAHKRARKGKTLKPYVIEFDKKLEENLAKLRNELLLQTYQPQPLKTFILRDPKTRKISKAHFRDRVIHHAICQIIEPLYDKTFIHDSFANRTGKGTLNAVKRFNQFKKKASKNNTIKCFVLKADIKSYFDTVNHDKLIELLNKKIEDQNVLDLIRTILNNHQIKKIGKGMPLGNLTSQFFANVYLNELDQYVKHELKAKYYIRYVDDFVVLHQSRVLLEDYKEKIDLFLKEFLSLKLHPDKSQIIKLEKGIHFLGMRIFYHHSLLVKRNMRKFENKMLRLKIEYENNEINREKIVEKFEGWLAYSSNANTYKFRKQMTKDFNKYFPIKPANKILSVKKYENFNKKIDESNKDFSSQKTLQLVKKGYTIEKICELRGIKENTVWGHITRLVEHHQLPLKRVMDTKTVRKILNNIKTSEDTLKDIKERINDNTITYNQIQVILANVKSHQKKKSLLYQVEWYKKTNCYRKCYKNKKQRHICRIRFQELVNKNPEVNFTKKEFLTFINKQTTICELSQEEKEKHLTWQDFAKIKHSQSKKPAHTIQKTIRNKQISAYQ